MDKGKKERYERRPDYASRRTDSDNGGRFTENKTITKVTCDTCGKSCTVPFRPSSGKAVYCNDCFGKNPSAARGDRYASSKPYAGSTPRSSYNDNTVASSRDLDKINSKLDRILDLLEGSKG